MLRAVSIKRAGELEQGPAPFDIVVLVHDERHLRRKVITLSGGDKVLVDFAQSIALSDGDALVLEDGRLAGIVAAEEDLCDVRGRDDVHLAELAWHIGNRHLAAAIGADRILILRDHVIRAMLEGLGASVTEVREPFSPLGGAYSGSHSHRHDHGRHAHGHGHRHEHGQSAEGEQVSDARQDHGDRRGCNESHARHRPSASARHLRDG